jgi:hypothetical protein
VRRSQEDEHGEFISTAKLEFWLLQVLLLRDIEKIMYDGQFSSKE